MSQANPSSSASSGIQGGYGGITNNPSNNMMWIVVAIGLILAAVVFIKRP